MRTFTLNLMWALTVAASTLFLEAKVLFFIKANSPLTIYVYMYLSKHAKHATLVWVHLFPKDHFP